MQSADPTPVLVFIVALMWTLFIGLFAVPVARARRRRQREIAWLKSNGWRVEVTVARVEVSAGASRYQAPRHFLIAQAWDAPDGKESYTFKSDPLSGSLADDLVGATVDVLIDPDDPNRYYMDVTTLR